MKILFNTFLLSTHTINPANGKIYIYNIQPMKEHICGIQI